MVDIQSKEVIDKMSQDLKVQPSMMLPRELGKMIIPVYNVNPVAGLFTIRSGTASDATTATIIATSSTKRTFLTSINLSVAKSVASPSIVSTVQAFVIGKGNQNIHQIRYEPLTAGQFTDSITYPIPIELEQGTNVLVTNSSATASIDTTATISFFEVDPQ